MQLSKTSLLRHWPLLIFMGGNGGGATMVYSLNTTLTFNFQGIWTSGHGSQMQCRLYTAFFASTMALLWWLYLSLYQSNPGFITPDSTASSAAPHDRYCQRCGGPVPMRSKHDSRTGRCVTKFDHFCGMLNTPIGDMNHARFWLFVVLQTFMAAWGICVCWEAVSCLWPFRNANLVSCWRLHPGRTVLLLLFLFFLLGAVQGLCGLAIAHSYLASTGQTTYEVLKGIKVPYLAPYYAGYAGPSMLPARAKGVRLLLQQIIRHRNPPPAPWNRGICANLNEFFYDPKPVAYQEQSRTLINVGI